MSARNLQPSGASPPHPSTTFHHSTQTLSSQKEGTEGDEESSVEEFLFLQELESPEEYQYLEEEENYLKGKEYLDEKEYLKEEKYLQKKELLEGKMFLYEKFLEEALICQSPSMGTCIISLGPRGHLKDDWNEQVEWGKESTRDAHFLQRQADAIMSLHGLEATWLYGSCSSSSYRKRHIPKVSPQSQPSSLSWDQRRRPPRAHVSQSLFTAAPEIHACITHLLCKLSWLEKPETHPGAVTGHGRSHHLGAQYPDHDREDSSPEAGEANGMSLLGGHMCWSGVAQPGWDENFDQAPPAGLLSGQHDRPMVLLDGKSNFTFYQKGSKRRNSCEDPPRVVTSSYQSVFGTMLREMAAGNELEEDINIPLTGHLESETRRKLGILLKKNFGKYKETILWIMKKRENLFSQRATETTFTFHVCNLPPQDESEKVVKQSRHLVRRKKTLEIHTDWIKSKIKVHQGDGKIILYPSEIVFQILFPDGSGQIYYPSGHLAMLILSIKEGKFTYIVLEDSENMCVRALINNSGHATFYDENGNIWLNLSPNLGYYFARDKYQKAWNWWDLKCHIHAPPVQPISLNINQYIKVQIRSQDKIIFHFIHTKQHICLNLGTKYKYITPAVLSEMKKKAVLEMELSSTARKIQILLGKMRKILSILTTSDLECFIQGSKILPTRQYELEEELSSSKPGQSPNCAALARAERFGEVELSKAPRKPPKP
ncbi:glutamate-rich protein 6B [Monodon monoceros]|uniref:glutamate-rich protein 6B n=1 Tax=Monodon monoceros TaxID=40151 RepID=UPI0010F8D981|nr:glutamate-rich protein 6B [Monodon monoceros]